MNKTTAILMIALLTGCTNQQAQQQAEQQAYNELMEYKSYNCKQLSKEMARTSVQLDQARAQNQTNGLMTTALAAYMVSQRYAFTTGDNNDGQIGYLQAKMNVLQEQSIKKNCN